MTTMTAVSDPLRPRCVCCGKPLRYFTDVVRAPHVPNSMVPVAGWYYPGNHKVVSWRYAEVFVHASGKQELWDAGWEDEQAWNWRPPEQRQGRRERRLSEVFVWDGERYSTPLWPFCSGPCIQRFAQAAWRGGWRMPRAVEIAA